MAYPPKLLTDTKLKETKSRANPVYSSAGATITATGFIQRLPAGAIDLEAYLPTKIQGTQRQIKNDGPLAAI